MSNEILKQNINALKNQLDWLEYSFEKCKTIGTKINYTPEEFDNFETLSSRFARSIDFLVRKVFRSLDDVEFERQGSLIDVVNNAHKRGLFDNEKEINVIRNIRNDITHEYLDEGLKDLFESLLKYTPSLIEMIKNTLIYAEKHIE